MIPDPALLDLPLFPLQAVLFPGGLLILKVFEARYLDLVSTCLRESTPFGVVALRQGTEVRRGGDEPVLMESLGVLSDLIEVDSALSGILQVRCRGTRRFQVQATHQQNDGLWQAQVELLADDEAVPPTAALTETVRGLANAIATLKQQGSEPFLKPFQFDSAGWVANRWCEILPLPVDAKHRLLGLDPLARLDIIDSLMRVRHTPH